MKKIKEIKDNFDIKDLLNVEIESKRYEDKKHDYCYWYGGFVANVKASSGEYRIYARGQIRCDLIAKKGFKDEYGNEYKEGKILATIKDKNEDGIFMNEMSYFIKDDSELSEILQGKHELYELKIENNNWFNLEFYNREGEFEYDYDLESIRLDDAIEEVKEIIWNQNKNNIQYGIYCRVQSSYDSDFALNNQQYNCIKILNDNIKNNTDVIRIYRDFSSIKKLPAALTNMLADIEDKKIKTIYTYSLSRLTRNTEQLYNIQKILKKNNADIFSIKENISIRDNLLIINPNEIIPIEKDNTNERVNESEYNR